MSPTDQGPNEVLMDNNYFVWEFMARMTLARKDLLHHVEIKPEHAVLRETAEWKAADLKALAVIVKLLSPTYQTMIREATSAFEAWDMLRSFFARRNLHNRVQLRKELHEFKLESGGSVIEHMLKFDELCLKLAAAGDIVDENEKLVVLLGSLPQEYDAMVRIIESQASVTLLDAKEMLRREYETISKREKQESAFRAQVSTTRDRFNGGRGGQRYQQGQNGRGRQQGNRRFNRGGRRFGQGRFDGECFECHQYGHKRNQCPRVRQHDGNGGSNGNEVVFAATEGDKSASAWILDSGASSHMSFDRDDFCELRTLTTPMDISVANGHRLSASGVGSVRFSTLQGRAVRLEDVLYVPGLDRKLISVPALTARGAIVRFQDDSCAIEYGGDLIAVVARIGKLFIWDVMVQKLALSVSELIPVSKYQVDNSLMTSSIESAAAHEATSLLWHARLGHVAVSRLPAIASAAVGVPTLQIKTKEDGTCSGCAYGKMTVSKYAHTSGSEVKSLAPLDIIHSDVMGPMSPLSKGKARYIVTFIDDFSRFVSVFMIKSKQEVLSRFKEFVQLMQTQLNRRVKCIRTDNGGEYCSTAFAQFCTSRGIIHQTSAPYSPQQNGLAERMNRTIVESARSMLHYQHLDRHWWGEAIMTAVYLINRIPNSARPRTTPFEMLFGKKPVLDHLRVFGSRGYVYVEKVKRSKWEAKAHRCIFLGYAEGSKAYRVWDLDDDRMVVTRSIALNERPPSEFVTMNHDNISTATRWVVINDDNDEIPVTRDPQPEPSNGSDSMDVDDDSAASHMDVDSGSVPGSNGELTALHPSVLENAIRIVPRQGEMPVYRGHNSQIIQPPRGELVAPPMSQVLARRGDRMVFSVPPRRDVPIGRDPENGGAKRILPSENCDTVPALTHEELLRLPPATSESANTQLTVTNASEPANKKQRTDDEYEIALAAESLPQTYSEAMAAPDSSNWKEAIKAELQAHFRNHTWDLVVRPPGAKVIGHKWVFAIKRDENGSVVKYKARLVALGFLQTHGIDYNKTYSPVASLNTVRIFLAICCQLSYYIKQFDVETAFLNGDLEETVYMWPPEGIQVRDGMVCKLRRSLYGLKQAAAVWHKTIRDCFVELGFKQCTSDSCLFVRVGKDGPVYIVLYVDDLLIGCLKATDSDQIANALLERFKIKQLGDARFILGIEVQYCREKGELVLRQPQYITRLLSKYDLQDAYPVRCPFVLGQDLYASDSNAIDDDLRSRFRELVGSLLYVANATRPDICMIVGQLSQYLEAPRLMHWNAALRVLRYLKGTTSLGIVYNGKDVTNGGLTAFSDANWGGELNSRKSTSGVLVKLACGPVIFRSKKQTTVALSSAEAEYMALALTVQEVLWATHVLNEMNVELKEAVKVFVDNKAAIAMATNCGYTPRAKHIDLRYHFVRDHVEQGKITIEHVPSKQQQADFLTKPVPTPHFTTLVEMSGLRDQQVEGECREQ